MDEDYSAGPEINEPVRERSNQHGSESSTLEIDVYVWHYALIVVHARNERMNERGGRGDNDRLAKSSGIDVKCCVTAHCSLQQ